MLMFGWEIFVLGGLTHRLSRAIRFSPGGKSGVSPRPVSSSLVALTCLLHIHFRRRELPLLSLPPLFAKASAKANYNSGAEPPATGAGEPKNGANLCLCLSCCPQSSLSLAPQPCTRLICTLEFKRKIKTFYFPLKLSLTCSALRLFRYNFLVLNQSKMKTGVKIFFIAILLIPAVIKRKSGNSIDYLL
jgi:hypothetical protein